MRRALVTGGCGFLGSWIVRYLEKEDVEVRALALPGESRENLRGLDVEVVEGNLLRATDAARAVEGMDTVFHTAAVYEDWVPDPTHMYAVNVSGTFNAIEAARAAGARRVICTASLSALGRPEPGSIADELTPYDGWDQDFPYSRTKYLALLLAESFASWGLDVRTVCPGILLGPRDIRPTPSGRILLTAMGPGPGFYYEGGASYVDVRDAARAHVLAAKHGNAGERYVATAHNLTNRELLRAVDQVAHRRRKHVKLPLSMARTIARKMDTRAHKTGKAPVLSQDFFEYSLKPNFFSSRKAKEELGTTFRPLHDTLRDAIEYFRDRGLINR